MERAIDRIEPFQRAIAKAHLASAGISIDALDHKPLIAVANSWNEICPGHEPLKQLAEEVKKGILEAGGEPIEFNTVAMCDGIAQGSPGMRYCLPHREIITDSIEAMVAGEGVFDGIVFLGACDKIVPAMLNAAARLDLPSILVTAGPCVPKIKPSQSKELRQRFLRGEITERQLIEGTLKYYTGPGICPFLGTANTMGALCESLGMMLPGGSLIPSSTSMRRFSARKSGEVLMKMVENQVKPSQIMTKNALENPAQRPGRILKRHDPPAGSGSGAGPFPHLGGDRQDHLQDTGAHRHRAKRRRDGGGPALCGRRSRGDEGAGPGTPLRGEGGGRPHLERGIG